MMVKIKKHGGNKKKNIAKCCVYFNVLIWSRRSDILNKNDGLDKRFL